VETPLGGGPYTGYPSFNTPDEMGLAVIDAGFDVALQASNHSMDSGTDGIRHAIRFWKSHADQILMVGLHDSAEEESQIPIITVNGISIAVLNYTYGLNGYELPYEEDYLITLMNDGTRDFIRDQVERASSQADFVIVCPHWGEENRVGEPTYEQEDWAMLFTEAGADLILGTHPHVIEDIEWITANNGNRALCYYSLGNFVSNQQYTDLVLGGMAYLVIEQDEQGTHIKEDSAKVIPVVTHNDKTGDPVVIQTYYLADYTQDLADVHDTYLSFDGDFSVSLLEQKAGSVFGSWMIDRIPH
jgi:poly-gamma-glutamate synthesis protein (capsule biosynthesis protein)